MSDTACTDRYEAGRYEPYRYETDRPETAGSAFRRFADGLDRDGLTLGRMLARWYARWQMRRTLARTETRLLDDMGIDPTEARAEITKPFWRA